MEGHYANCQRAMVETFKQQPSDSSHKEILGELTFALLNQRGLENSGSVRTISNEDVELRIRTLVPNIPYVFIFPFQVFARKLFLIKCM